MSAEPIPIIVMYMDLAECHNMFRLSLFQHVICMDLAQCNRSRGLTLFHFLYQIKN